MAEYGCWLPQYERSGELCGGKTNLKASQRKPAKGQLFIRRNDLSQYRRCQPCDEEITRRKAGENNDIVAMASESLNNFI